MLVTKLLLPHVLCLIEAVGIDKERLILDIRYRLAGILYVGHYTDRRIGLHLQEVSIRAATS